MKRILAVLLFCLAAIPLAAETSHQISKIEFRGTKIPTAILRAETTLSEGTYTDEELQRAVYRIKRLPFVYDARYTVEGSTLVIEVVDVHRFFYSLNAIGARFQPSDSGTLDTGIGGRLYFRPGGVLEGSGGDAVLNHGEQLNSVNLQYTQYALGGTRAFATVGISRTNVFGGNGRSALVPRLAIGVPLNVDQTVTLSALRQTFSASSSDFIVPRVLRQSARTDSVELRWRYDTTDDPFFFTRGTELSIAPAYVRNRSDFESLGDPNIFLSQQRGHSAELRADARRLLTLPAGNVLFGGLEAIWSRHDFDIPGAGSIPGARSTTTEFSPLLGYAHNFFDIRGPEVLRRSRIETSVSYIRRTFDREPDIFRGDVWQGEFAYVFRHQWGTIRATISYEKR